MKNIFPVVAFFALTVIASSASADDWRNLVTCDGGAISIDFRSNTKPSPGVYEFQMVLRGNVESYLNDYRHLSVPINARQEIVVGGMSENSPEAVWNNSELFNIGVGEKGPFYWFTFLSSNTLIIGGEGSANPLYGSYHFNTCYRLN